MNLTKTANIQYTKSAPEKSGVGLGSLNNFYGVQRTALQKTICGFFVHLSRPFFIKGLIGVSLTRCELVNTVRQSYKHSCPMMERVGTSKDVLLSVETVCQPYTFHRPLLGSSGDGLKSIYSTEQSIMTNISSIATPVAIKNISFENIQVSFTHDAYLNATAIAKQFGKRVQHYLNNERTQEYIVALTEAVFTASTSQSETLKSVTDKNQLVIVKKGGKAQEQGTWLHPKLAIDFARWLNPKFAVWCDMQIEKILKGESTTEQKTFTAEVFHDLAYQNYMTSVLVAHVENHIVPFLESIRSKDLSFYTVLLEELKAQTQQNCTQLYKNMPEAYHEHKSKRLPFTTYKYLQLAHGFHDDKGYGTHFYPILRNNSVYCSV